MWYHKVKVGVVVLVLALQACVPRTPKPSEALAATVSVESISELRAYVGGTETVHSPQAGGAEPLVCLLAGTIPRINLQAACFLREEDVAQIRANGDSLELAFASPSDVVISQRIEEKQQAQIPVDARGYRILRVDRALFVLRGEMAAHVLVRDPDGAWGCWAIESDGSVDSRWVGDLEAAMEGSGLR